jgi:hypothetical protein
MKLHLECLDDRIVPSAILDLTSSGALAATPGGAIVQQTAAQPTGTGVIHSFLRIQGPASGGKSEQGYNTDARPLQFDENKSPVFTRSLKTADVPIVTIDGQTYREFLLDINQNGRDSKLSLDEVRIYLGHQPNLTGYDPNGKTLAGLTPVFDLDAGGDVSVLLDARLNSGSGSGDMLLYVPSAAFTGGEYVYLYSKLGVQTGATANGGFEEWAVRTGAAPVDSGGNASLSGRVFVDYNNDGLMNNADYGIGGVTIQLIGVDDLGRTVSLTTTTAADGTYTFTGLRAGTYSIVEGAFPPDIAGLYVDGKDSIGTINGVTTGENATNDQFTGIKLADGQNGIEYNFAELLGE